MEIDTIAAIATPIGSSGIGIIRISGHNASEIILRIFLPSKKSTYKYTKMQPDFLRSHFLTHGFIFNPDDESMVDEVLVVWMKSPWTYTREDVVEIQAHSGPVILRKILTLVLDSGARLANPGEFTKRAFLNGRIDLSQAEAVADMIDAKTDKALKVATNQLSGGMQKSVSTLLDKITGIQARLEANIEFPEDISDAIDYPAIKQSLVSEITQPIDQLIQLYDDGHVLRDGVRMGIVGRPNVGKSSLLNRLIQKERAIVTPFPGTTRDLIEDHFSIGGIPIIITDTAGLHAATDPVEKIGIQKTQENIEQSDLVLFVIDANSPFTKEDDAIYKLIDAFNVLLVINKCDLLHSSDSIIIPENYAQHPAVHISALYGHGIDQLKKAVQRICLKGIRIEPGRTIVPNLRQKQLLVNSLKTLNKVLGGLDSNLSEELIVSDLAQAKNDLNQVLGRDVHNDILDEIFNKFCIGK